MQPLFEELRTADAARVCGRGGIYQCSMAILSNVIVARDRCPGSLPVFVAMVRICAESIGCMHSVVSNTKSVSKS